MSNKRGRDSPSNNSPALKQQSLSYEKIFVPYEDTPIIMLNTNNEDVLIYFIKVLCYHGHADSIHDGTSGRGAIIKTSSAEIRELIQFMNLGTGSIMTTNGTNYYISSSVHALNDMLNRNLHSGTAFEVDGKSILLPPSYKGDYNEMINSNGDPMPGYTYFFKNYHVPKDANGERDYRRHGPIIKKFTGIQSTHYVLDCGQSGLHKNIAIKGEKQQLSGKLDSSSSSGSSQSGALFCLPFMYIYKGVDKVGVIMYGAAGTGGNPNVYFKYFPGTDMKNINNQCKTFNTDKSWESIKNLEMVPTLPDVLNMFTFTNVIRDCFNSIFNKKKLQTKKQSCRPFMEIASNLFIKIGKDTIWGNENIKFIKAFLLCVKKYGDISRVVDNEINRISGINSFTGTTDTFLTNFACLTNLSVCYSNDKHTLVINDPTTNPTKAAEMKLAQEEKESALSINLKEIGQGQYPNIFDIFNDQHIIRISRISDPLGRIPQQRQAKAITALLKVSFMLKKDTNPTLEIKYSFEQLFLLWKIHQILTNNRLSGKKLINKGNFILLLKKQRLIYDNSTKNVSVNDDNEPNILNDLFTNFNNNQKIEDLKNLFGNKPNVKEGGLYDIVDNYYTDLGIPTENPNDFFRRDLLNKIIRDKANGKIVPASGGGLVKRLPKAIKAMGNRLPFTEKNKQNFLINNIDNSISKIENLQIDYWENGTINESDYDNELIKEQIRLFTNLYRLNKHNRIVAKLYNYITNDTIKIENPNTNKIETISQQYTIQMYYDFLKPYIKDVAIIYDEFFLNDDVHTLYKRNFSKVNSEVDTQNNIPVNMRTGIRSEPGMQSNSLLPMNNPNPFAMTVGGKKKTRKHKKNVKQKTRKHKKNSTYKKK